jgi:hypothetical protein
MYNFVTAALAVFAVSSLLTEYEGFKNAFAILRDKFPDSPLKCLVCTSLYVAVLFYILNYYGIDQHLLPLATIGAIILIERIKWS